jgi:NADPH2 dehydrogenase
MCHYSVDKEDGIPNDWHFVHYVSRAIGDTGLIIMEMTSVTPEGRITNQDLGLWDDAQIPAYKRIVSEIHKYGSKIGIQIAHAVERPKMQSSLLDHLIYKVKLYPRKQNMVDLNNLAL